MTVTDTAERHVMQLLAMAVCIIVTLATGQGQPVVLSSLPTGEQLTESNIVVQ